MALYCVAVELIGEPSEWKVNIMTSYKMYFEPLSKTQKILNIFRKIFGLSIVTETIVCIMEEKPTLALPAPQNSCAGQLSAGDR
jgi:hypothetical protein